LSAECASERIFENRSIIGKDMDKSKVACCGVVDLAWHVYDIGGLFKTRIDWVIGYKAGGGDAEISGASYIRDNLTPDVGTLLYSAPEQLQNTEHSSKVSFDTRSW